MAMSDSQTIGIPVTVNGETFFRCRKCQNFQLVMQDELEDGVCAFCAVEDESNAD